MKLNSLELRNFKGIRNLDVTPNGKDIDIYGENGAGKTTIFDSFMWLLFDKDSTNSSNFDIKTTDENGQVLHGLEHEVKGTIVIEDRILELQKIYKEKWTKKRGETEQTLTGHTTDYFIDGVPKLKKEYTEFLGSIIDEEMFRVITNPLYFNTRLDWKKRRATALELVDHIESQEVLKSNNKLKGLEELLTLDTTAEDLKAKTQATKRKLNKRLEQIPVRIDELSRQNLSEDINFGELEEKKLKLEKQIKSLENDNINAGNLEELKQEVSFLESWKLTFERDKTISLNEQYKNVNIQLQEIQKEANGLSSSKQKLDNEIDLLENKINFKVQELDSLREAWSEIIKDEFDMDENICRSCGQGLQAEKQEENIEKFNDNKKKRKNKNSTAGIKVKSEVVALKEQVETKKEESNTLEQRILDKEKRVNTITNTLENISKRLDSIDFNSFEEYQETSLKIIRLNREIEDILTVNKGKSQEQQNERVELEHRLSNVVTLLSKKEVIESNLKRVEELKEEERELAEQIAQLEKTEMQCEQFIITKAGLLEDKLNDKFKIVKFKLFNKLVNGAIEETFETMMAGTTFDNLSKGEKIVAGLDIINTLSEHYNFKAPIFLEDAESITVPIEINTQILQLKAKKDKDVIKMLEKDKEVEVQNGKGEKILATKICCSEDKKTKEVA